MPHPDATAGYSKAPRGLFVRSWGGRVFTASTISPGSSLRQRPSRYTFRAGRNLPDKEFRYLRTVIVTAAVYRGFGSALARLPLTFRHWAGISPHTSACALAETCVCGKQSPGPLRCGPLALRRPAPSRYAGHPFSRSYGVSLPSSLTKVPSPTLVFSTSPPVSVCGTVARSLASGFSRRHGPARSVGSETRLALAPRSTPGGTSLPGLPTGFDALHADAGRAGRRPRLARNGVPWYGNLHPLAIAYGSRPRLRSDSPAADRPCCGTLGHSVWPILTAIALLIPAFALPSAPPWVTPRLRRWMERSPTKPCRVPAARATRLPWLR